MHFSAVSVLDYRCGILLLFTFVMEKHVRGTANDRNGTRLATSLGGSKNELYAMSSPRHPLTRTVLSIHLCYHVS